MAGTASAAPAPEAGPLATTTTTSSDTPSSAGITQVRFCGSAAHSTALSARLPRAPRYARSILAPVDFVERLAGVRIGSTFNQYGEGPRAPLLRERLLAYLEARCDAPVLLVGEAPGYRGARVSGIPFTSERQLTGSGPVEATATVVQRVLAEPGLVERTLLWNLVPTHPHREHDWAPNRRPTAGEIKAGAPFLTELMGTRRVVAVGRLAQSALGSVGVRHPSHGGACAFRAGLRLLVADL